MNINNTINNTYNIRIFIDSDSLLNNQEYLLSFHNGIIKIGDKIKRSLGPYYRINNNDSLIKNNEVCTVCLETYKVGTYKRNLCCSHTFHKKCIDKWFKISESQNCPICRNHHDNILKTIKQN